MKMAAAAGKVLGLVGAVCVPITFFDLIAYPSYVSGASMEPTLFNGDFVWVSRIHSVPSVGGIFCFTCPYDPRKTHIKRVAATQSEGAAVDKRGQPVPVPANHLWMRSDNLTSATVLDSQHYGPVNCGLLKGKALLIIWPPSRWARLK